MKDTNRNFITIYMLCLMLTLCVVAIAYIATVLGVMSTIMGLTINLFGFFVYKLYQRIGGIKDEV